MDFKIRLQKVPFYRRIREAIFSASKCSEKRISEFLIFIESWMVVLNIMPFAGFYKNQKF
jgi:hypothetical protein